MVAFLTGREPEPAIDRTAKLEAQRDILIELLAGAALPRNI
jgi:hypothetical protein